MINLTRPLLILPFFLIFQDDEDYPTSSGGALQNHRNMTPYPLPGAFGCP
jgi:hypothetical protein